MTVGRHAAADGASAHPIVADALAHRDGGALAAHSAERADGESGLGWPAPPPQEGGGPGWPGDVDD
jgi:hypothetical protein